jgi:hypothetical protein
LLCPPPPLLPRKCSGARIHSTRAHTHTHAVTHSRARSHSLTQSLTHSLNTTHTRSLFHSLTRSSTRSLTLTHSITVSVPHTHTHALARARAHTHTHTHKHTHKHTNTPGNRSHTDRAALNEPRKAAIKTGSMSITRRTSCSRSRFSRGVPRHEQARGRRGAKDKTVTRRLPLQKITARHRWPLVKAGVRETAKGAWGHDPVSGPVSWCHVVQSASLCELFAFFLFCQMRT